MRVLIIWKVKIPQIAHDMICSSRIGEPNRVDLVGLLEFLREMSLSRLAPGWGRVQLFIVLVVTDDGDMPLLPVDLTSRAIFIFTEDCMSCWNDRIHHGIPIVACLL